MQVFEGDKTGIILDEESHSITVNEATSEDFIDAADYAIIHFGMVNQDYLNDLGCELQLLFDEIYYQTRKSK